MNKPGMVKFLALRILILLPVACASAFFLNDFNLVIPSAAILGSLLSIYKLSLWNRLFNVLVTGPTGTSKKFTLLFTATLLFTLLILTVFAALNVFLFLGFALGYLLLPAVIMVNAITEALHITNNGWGDDKR